MMAAPIALFVYNRPWHTRQTVEALLVNEEASETALYVFSDAPKNTEAIEAVAEVRAFIRGLSGFKSVFLIERETNLGLAKSIIDGVTRVCNEHGRVVVVEDDLVTSPYFLRFMNEGLEKYRDDSRVISIHGYIYPVEQTLPETFFLRGADCWGWATWSRGWELFESDGRKLLDELKRRNLMREFDFEDSYPYVKMLQHQIAGKNNSWAIRWYASAFLKDKLTLYPGKSLVHNIGVDGSGSHCSATSDYFVELVQSPIPIKNMPIEDSIIARRAIVEFHKKSQLSIMKKLFRKVLGVAPMVGKVTSGK